MKLLEIKNTISEKKNLVYGINRLGCKVEMISELEDIGIESIQNEIEKNKQSSSDLWDNIK